MKSVTNHVEGLIKKQIELIDSYDLVQVNSNTWWSKYNGISDESDEPKKTCQFIPKFRRVRVINLLQDGTLHCSCHLPDRFRIPCGHIIKINAGLVKAEDVCVSNYVEYAQMYGDIRFPEITNEFDTKMRNYNGPCYHPQSPTENNNPTYPIFHCLKEDDKNLDYFHNGNTNHVDLINYERRLYEQYLPQDQQRLNITENIDTTDYIGFSESHFTQEDTDIEEENLPAVTINKGM